jgi:Alpha/beta hydrolase domain
MTNLIELRISERGAFAADYAFGSAGPYERIVGRAHYALDPMAPAQQGIVDLQYAPRDPRGLVRFAADFMILKPKDLARGNRRLFLDYGNRGNKRMLQFFNDASASNDPRTLAHAGNGFLFRRGYTVAWIAWQGDLLPGDGRMLMDAPVATDHGKPITGKVRVEYILEEKGVTTQPLSAWVSTRSYPTVSLDTREAQLTRRRYPDDPRIPIPPDQWCFARVEGGQGLDNQGSESALVPSDTNIHIPRGFEPGWIYELVYTAKDPLVLGLGHVAVRDFVSFLKYATADAAGTANPLAEGGRIAIEKTYGWGRSQTGRCLRDFVHRGFNADAQNRRVFDGILPHVSGGGLMWLNHRFASGVSPAGQQYEDHENCADRFPFSYAMSTNHLTGQRDAILKRPETDPLVIHTQSATEYWQRRGSLVHTDTRGNDLDQPQTVRVYQWSSSQHFADPNLKKPGRGVCENVINVVRTSMLFRAMIDAMDRWASDGTPPPPSRIPRRADGTLVTAEEWRRQFPHIPGALLPTGPNELPLYDFGLDFERGILREPPQWVPGKSYTVLVPAVDADGNEISGVRAPMVGAPLATYTGWTIRSRGFGHGATHTFVGSTIPFAETETERRYTGDPRPSIHERYASKAAYQAAIAEAARKLVDAGLMLAEDVERAIADAADWSAPRHEVGLD